MRRESVATPTAGAGAGVVTTTWTRLGADGPRLVRTSGWLYERAAAARDRRPPCGLVHAALDVDVLPARTRVEMTPVWGQPPAHRGVVAEGPVGAAWLGVSRFFRYEVRRWAGAPRAPSAGVVARLRVPVDAATARRVLAALDDVPTPTWGRVPRSTPGRDMWTSNSVVAWVVVRAGLDVAALAPPPGWRAPGWAAGLHAARTAAALPRRPGPR